MGAPDGTEVCEIVGLLILYKLKTKFKNLDFGLYRVNGLAVSSRIVLKQLDEDAIRKDLHRPDLSKCLVVLGSDWLSLATARPNIWHAQIEKKA